MPKPLKKPPKFKTEAQERKFWESHDSTEFVDSARAGSVHLPNLKLTTRTISLRLPTPLLEQIKIEANKRDIPYQSLIKVWLKEKVSRS